MNHENVFNSEEKIKIVFLGSPSVGKTSILNRWICGEYNEKVSPTVSAANVQKEITYKNKQLKAVICDTAGEERYQSLCGNFIHGADCVLIVCSYDIKASFDAINSWIELVYEKCPETTNIIIVKNKIDLTTDVDTSISATSDGKYQIYYVSAKTGENIDVLFMAAVEQAYLAHISTIEVVRTIPSIEQNTQQNNNNQSCC